MSDARDALLPCPFCGGEAEFERMGDHRQSCQVRCNNCGCSHESSDEGIESGASWNRRAQAERGAVAEGGTVPREPIVCVGGTTRCPDPRCANGCILAASRRVIDLWQAMWDAAPRASEAKPDAAPAIDAPDDMTVTGSHPTPAPAAAPTDDAARPAITDAEVAKDKP